MTALDKIWGKWGIYIIVIAALFIIAGWTPSPEDMEMRLPQLDDPVMWFTFLVAAIMIVWPWSTCGSDHEENVDPEHPDGRLTYPGGQN